MFQKMWPTWTGDDTASATGSAASSSNIGSSSTTNNKRPPVTATTTSSSIMDDDDEARLSEIGNDDDLADHLLVQFPAYGTRNQAQNNNLNQTADWLLGGTSNIPNQQQLLKQQQLQQQQLVEDESSSSPPLDEKQQKANEMLAANLQNYRDWDDDEQQLWRNSRLTTNKKPTSNRRNNNSNKSLSLSKARGSEFKEETPKEVDPSNDWLMAYYYHTGVTPKFEPRNRNKLTFEQTTRQDFRSPFAKLAKPHNEDVSNTSLVLLSAAEKKKMPAAGGGGPPNLMSPLNRITPIEVSEDEEEFSGRPTITTRSLTPPGAPDVLLSAEDRQHWMPDRLCKHCYACDSQFTVFRRRHHCRLCGQVFCNTCSGYFVPASQDPSNKTILRTCKMCFDQVTAQQQLMEEVEAADAGRKRRKKEEPLSPPEVKQGQSTAVSPTLQEQLDRGDSVLHNLSKKRTESAFTQRRRINQQHAIEQDEKEQTSQILHQQERRTKLEAKDMLIPSSPKRSESSTQQSHSSSTSLKSDADRARAVEEGNTHLGLAAAAHLEKLGDGLLATDAPLLWKELCRQYPGDGARQLHQHWLNKLMSLATRCCATVEPNLKKGDLLDIRPYVKIKVIPGGSYRDCAYISGVLFRKTVSHKSMAREITNPRIMLLSGGIEFTRTENRIASFETLMEQEGKYMEILVGRIVKLKPDILLVGRAVSRRAQELLIKARVVLMQHVKSSLLNRISRQTGAKIISSTDHIMNQFGAHVLGKCHRFRIIVARDNEVWIDGEVLKEGGKLQRNIGNLLSDPKLPNHERQAALAANMLGEGILDGAEAVKSGLAKRGVAQTYVMMEGCPKQLGCTVVLRGASRAALKQVKIVFRFLINAAYNLRLETAYLKERCARLRPEYEVQQQNICSSSLCVDYGALPSGRKIRPWNGGSNNDGVQRSISGKVTAFDHQAILISSVWMTDKTQCCPAEVKGICYYSMQDVSLGQFLRDSCFNLSLKCQNPTCKKSVLDHSLSFVHNDGLINITVDHMDDPLPPAPLDGSRKVDGANKDDDDEDSTEVEDTPIATWTYCKNCGKIVTPLVYISDNTWKYSFGKFLESFFYNRYTVMNSPQAECGCALQTSGILFFGCGRLAARFTYERLRPFGVFVRKHLPIDSAFHRSSALRHLELISMASSQLFVKFDKHIEKVSREARSLLGNSSNRPDHLQTLLSELNRIGSEVDHAAKTLQEKIASVSDKCSKDGEVVVSDALLRFPWFARRYLFMLTSAWNEKLSAAGQAIVAMKKLASSGNQRNDSVMGPNVPTIGGDPNSDELYEGMRRLRQLHEVYSRYNITDISTVLPIIPGNSKAELEYDDDFEDPDGTMDFNDGVDADVLASRRRLYNPNSLQSQSEQSRPPPTKSLGTRRSDEPRSRQQHRISPETIPNSTVTTKVTPGGAVKSAITRFFNRGGRESDPYVVNLGIFKEGRPRLEPGVNGIVVPVIDDQLCTVIAYSLSSTEYLTQFENFVKMESSNPDSSSTAGTSDTASTPLSDSGGAQRVRSNFADSHSAKSPSSNNANNSGGTSDKQGIERRMLVRSKSHIKHTFRDYDEKGQNLCKFVCTTYWATQFHAVRQAFLSPNGVKDSTDNNFSLQHALDVEQSYVQSLSSAYSWAASGGKSGASFARTSDDRFVIKCISRTELQMFLDCAPAYFEYLSKAFFHGLPTVLCKIVGVYQIGYHNRVTGKRSMEQIAVMQNIFYNKKISKTFDLKGSLRGRFAAHIQNAKNDDSRPDTPMQGSEGSLSDRKRGSDHGSDLDGDSEGDESNSATNSKGKGKGKGKTSSTLLDGDFLEFTAGRPMPMNDRAKAVFHMSILNDTLFLSIINVLDYSILIGIDEERMELVVGIIDFMRQYDILKQMERVGKSLPMVVGSEAPTIIQPPLYKARFINAMERYFMTVPSKWTTI